MFQFYVLSSYAMAVGPGVVPCILDHIISGNAPCWYGAIKRICTGRLSAVARCFNSVARPMAFHGHLHFLLFYFIGKGLL